MAKKLCLAVWGAILFLSAVSHLSAQQKQVSNREVDSIDGLVVSYQSAFCTAKKQGMNDSTAREAAFEQLTPDFRQFVLTQYSGEEWEGTEVVMQKVVASTPEGCDRF